MSKTDSILAGVSGVLRHTSRVLADSGSLFFVLLALNFVLTQNIFPESKQLQLYGICLVFGVIRSMND
jgi:hypothetical protein